MSSLETATGTPVGLGPATPLPSTAATPIAALEEVVAAPVRNGPCVVAFSGGRDSSLILAAAVRSAARQGCQPPIPATTRFRNDPGTHEDEWQCLVLDHLGLTNHVVIELDDEVDFVGPIAEVELRRRGPLFPPNSHVMSVLTEVAAGGTLLVGFGGDDLLTGHRWTQLNDALAGRRRPVLRDVVRVGVATLPPQARRRILARRGSFEPPAWLRPHVVPQLLRCYEELLDEPVRFDRVVAHAARARKLVVVRDTLRRLSSGLRIEAPLLDQRFVAALARAGGRRGWSDRNAAMRAIAADVLPDALLDRRDKARFVATYFGEATRAFARVWTGGGVDESLVDTAALRNEWLAPRPDFRSALLLQLAWLHDNHVERDSPR